MSQENVELSGNRNQSFDEWVESARKLWGLFNDGAYDKVLPFLDPEIELEDWPELPDRSWHHGIEGVGRWLGKLLEVVENPKVDLLEFFPVDQNRFLVEADFKVEMGKRSGIAMPVSVHAFAVVSMRDGKFRRVALFRSRTDALEAIGQRE